MVIVATALRMNSCYSNVLRIGIIDNSLLYKGIYSGRTGQERSLADQYARTHAHTHTRTHALDCLLMPMHLLCYCSADRVGRRQVLVYATDQRHALRRVLWNVLHISRCSGITQSSSAHQAVSTYNDNTATSRVTEAALLRLS